MLKKLLLLLYFFVYYLATKADCPEIEYIATPAHALNSYIDFLG